MEKRFFNNIVIISFIKFLTLSLTGIIDCAFVGRYLGTEGLSAMKLAMPLFLIYSFFSTVFASGLSVALPREMAVGNRVKAGRLFRTVITVTVVLGICFTAAGIIYPQAITNAFAGSADIGQVRVLTGDYLRPILIGALPILLYDVLGTVALLGGGGRIIRASSIALFVVDVAGDILSVWLGWGMLGIASASTAAYLVSCAVIFLYFLGAKALIRPGFCLPDMSALRSVVSTGLAGGIDMICKAFLPIAVNFFVLTYGTMPGLAALSVQDALQYIPQAMCIGISSATLILTGMCAAESDVKILRQEKMFVLRWSFVGGMTIAGILIVLASPILWLFTTDDTVHSLGVTALMLYLTGVPFIAVNSSVIAYFQGLGLRKAAAFFTIFRSLLSPLMFAWILGYFFGDLGIYASFTASELFVLAVLGAAHLIVKMRNIVIPDSFVDQDIIAEVKVTIKDPEQVVSASQQVNELCAANGVDPRQSYHVALMVEELATNTLQHGFEDRRDGHLELKFMITGSMLMIRLRDNGKPFDLTEQYKMLDPDVPDRNIGLRLVFAAADEVSYNSTMDLNNVYVRVRRVSEMN